MNIEQILSQMTLREKATLMTGKGNWRMNGIPRLGIRDFAVADGPHGLRAYQSLDENQGYPETRMPATMFPCASAMSSTFSPSLLEEVGKVIADECNHYGIDVILGPGVNGKRSPLGGRNFEYYSEDPFLTAECATAFVKGVQSHGVGTSLKHFILNEQEHSRRYADSRVDARTFRELYAYPFEQVVKRAHPTTIMSSYNRVGGHYASENPFLLETLLREQWGYDGIVISDWGAVQDKAKSVSASLDIEMPESEWIDAFIEDVVAGKYDEAKINQTVQRILSVYERLLANPNHGKKTDFARNHLVAQKVAERSMVLLKNNDILPLKKAEKLLLVGSFAASPRIGGGGSSDLMPFQIDLPLETIRARADVTIVDTYEVTNETMTKLVNFDHVLVFTGTTAKIESEGFDRRRIDLPLEQIECVKQISAIRNDVIVVNASGSAVALDGWTDGVGAILQTWFSGSAGGEAIARVLFGEVNPSGRLSETFPKRLENTPVYPGFPGNGDIVHYQEGLFTGYRFYDTHQIAVTYPFGYGLSYTNFVWSSPRFNTTYLKKTDTLECLVDVENTGPVAGIETVMIFVSMPKVGFVHPHKILRGFSQISLSPGEKQTVRVWIPVTDLSVYVDEVGQFMVEQGTYEIHFAKNVAEVAFSSTIQIASDDVCHQPKAMWQPANVWLLADPEKSMIHDLEEHYRKLHWWEKEEPLERILNRIASEWKMTVEEAAALKAPYLAIRPQQA